MPPRRRIVVTPQAAQTDIGDCPLDVGEAPEPKDPAQLAAEVLLRRSLSHDNLQVDVIGRDGTVVLVHLPDVAWAEHVRHAWKRVARGGQAGSDWDSRTYSFPCDWVVWSPYDPPRSSALKQANDVFAAAIAEGLHIAAFTHEVGWLPPDLVFSADYQIHIPVLTYADFVQVRKELFEVTGELTLSEQEAGRLTPRLLRLARRLEQTDHEYVAKLQGLLAREAVTAVKVSAPVRAAPALDRLHGMDEAVAWGFQLQADLAAYRRGEIGWADVDRGCLLSGPPGSGKTVFAQALAKTCDVPLIAGSYGEWHSAGSAHQGNFLKAMRRSFEDARTQAPTILFIDEIDSFPDRSKVSHRYAAYEMQIVNALLAEIDGVRLRDGVVLIGACNHPNKLDAALLRSGRLDRHIEIGLPGHAALRSILREHLGSDLTGIDLTRAALFAVGATGADCERFVRGARRRARLAKREIALDDLLKEVNGSEQMSEADLWLAAIHEAGHAVATCILRPGHLGSVSIGSRGIQSGTTSARPRNSIVIRPDDVHEQLVIILAGRAAEEELLGVASSGAGGTAQSDLGRATELTVNANSALGLSPDGSLVWRGMTDANTLRDMLAVDRVIARTVQLQLDNAYLAAWELVIENDHAIRLVAHELTKRRALDGQQVQALVDGVNSWSRSARM